MAQSRRKKNGRGLLSGEGLGDFQFVLWLVRF